jgi:hypothetical protein
MPPLPFLLCHFFFAISPLPYSLCRIPFAIFPLPYSLCRIPFEGADARVCELARHHSVWGEFALRDNTRHSIPARRLRTSPGSVDPKYRHGVAAQGKIYRSREPSASPAIDDWRTS